MGALPKIRRNPPLPVKLREIMSPAGSQRGFKQWWTLAKHPKLFGRARKTRDIIFLAAEAGKAGGSLHNVPAGRDPELWELHFQKTQVIPNNFWAKLDLVKRSVLSAEGSQGEIWGQSSLKRKERQ